MADGFKTYVSSKELAYNDDVRMIPTMLTCATELPRSLNNQSKNLRPFYLN